jgi:hypothetical protein
MIVLLSFLDCALVWRLDNTWKFGAALIKATFSATFYLTSEKVAKKIDIRQNTRSNTMVNVTICVLRTLKEIELCDLPQHNYV